MAGSVESLIYVGDPMCSWCWGFAPEIDSLADSHRVEVVVGGLRPGPVAQALDDRLADVLAHHWEEVAARTGQPFDTSFLDRRDGWVYDTEPAARAVVAIRDASPDRALRYFTAVQEAFYAEGRDVTDFEVLAAIAADAGLDAAAALEAMSSEDAKKRAWEDFSRSRSWGISGFPTLLASLGDPGLALLARGWARAGEIEARIRRLVEADLP